MVRAPVPGPGRDSVQFDCVESAQVVSGTAQHSGEDEQLTPTGFEQPAITSVGNKNLGNLTSASAAKSGAVDSDLGRIADAWPTLPEPIRRAILALVESVRELT
jgi:hypothetical protein